MEDAIPDGTRGGFRLFATGTTRAATALDGEGVVVQLCDQAEPETDRRYTVTCWRVTKHTADGGVEQFEPRPDSLAFWPKEPAANEFMEVVG